MNCWLRRSARPPPNTRDRTAAMEAMDSVISARTDLLQVAEVVAREKGIEPEQVLEAMEQAIQKAGRSKYGHEHDIRAVIDRKTGEIQLARYLEEIGRASCRERVCQ